MVVKIWRKFWAVSKISPLHSLSQNIEFEILQTNLEPLWILSYHIFTGHLQESRIWLILSLTRAPNFCRYNSKWQIDWNSNEPHILWCKNHPKNQWVYLVGSNETYFAPKILHPLFHPLLPPNSLCSARSPSGSVGIKSSSCREESGYGFSEISSLSSSCLLLKLLVVEIPFWFLGAMPNSIPSCSCLICNRFKAHTHISYGKTNSNLFLLETQCLILLLKACKSSIFAPMNWSIMQFS